MSRSPVAERIQKLLDERGEKLKTVCRKLDIEYYSVYPWWKRENHKLVKHKLEMFADYFGVPVEHLMYGDAIDQVPRSADNLVQRIRSLEGTERKDLENYLDLLEIRQIQREQNQKPESEPQ